MTLNFELYQTNKAIFGLERVLIQDAIDRCEPRALEALSVFGKSHLWQGRLPVYPILVSPPDNGGWGHLLPIWFKPHERPVPFYTLDNWALFASMYSHSFGPTDEARKLMVMCFNVENLVRVIVGSNLLLPFLPSTQGKGLFFRHGMLPFLLSILWLDEPDCHAWLRLHTLGAEQFVSGPHLSGEADPVETLELLEFAIFARLERNGIETDQAVAALLSPLPMSGRAGLKGDSEELSLLDAYRSLCGAICLGVAALAYAYASRPLGNWRTWAYQEFAFPYRTAEFGRQALRDWLKGTR